MSIKILQKLRSVNVVREILKEERLRLGLSQSALSTKTNRKISQSLITKFETGAIDTSYSNVVLLVDTLIGVDEQMNEGRMNPSSRTARDIYCKDIIFVGKNDPLRKARNIMLENNFSQLPVGSREKVVGSITDNTLLNLFAKGMTRRELDILFVKEVMERSFPIVDERDDIKILEDIIMYSPAILVSLQGEITGIITKADLIRRGN